MMKRTSIFISLLMVLFFVGTSFGASVIVNPKFLALVEGEPLASGLVYTYSCGTTTPKTTYTSYTGGTANDNPVVLSTHGEASIYASGCLKVIIKTSAGVTVDEGTIDNIYSFDNSVIQDADRDTIIQTEETADEDTIRFDVGGSQKMYIDSDGVHIGSTLTTEAYGRAERARLRWKDADEIYIGAGAYHHSGTSEQMVYWNSEITFELEAAGSNAASDDYAADGWHYIYLDDSAIVTQASALLDADCFLNSRATPPTYSASKHGWYAPGTGNTSTSDRCIFAVYETGDTTLEFYHMGNDYVQFADKISTNSSTNITDSFADATALRVPAFATLANVTFQSQYVDTTTTLNYRINGQTGTTGIVVGYVAAGVTVGVTTTNVLADANGLIEWKESAASSNTFSLYTNGWFFPIGF